MAVSKRLPSTYPAKAHKIPPRRVASDYTGDCEGTCVRCRAAPCVSTVCAFVSCARYTLPRPSVTPAACPRRVPERRACAPPVVRVVIELWRGTAVPIPGGCRSGRGRNRCGWQRCHDASRQGSGAQHPTMPGKTIVLETHISAFPLGPVIHLSRKRKRGSRNTTAVIDVLSSSQNPARISATPLSEA